jgi:hypothetical protein
MAKFSRASAQIIPFPPERTRRFARRNSLIAAEARELIQQTLEMMLKPKSRSDRRPS